MKFVANQTGLKPYLIRTWEARYRAIRPHRAANQRRCFTDEDIRRLILLKQAVDQGHAISSVAQLSNDDLAELLRRGELSSEGSGPRRLHIEEVDTTQSTLTDLAVDQAFGHIMRLDASSLEQVLNDASVELPRQAFLKDVILPLFQRIGQAWRKGKMKIINEHMASVVVRSILWEMLRSVIPAKSAPVIVVATPIGHWHEFGALSSALAAAELGWRVAYFGPNLPSEEMAYAVKHLRAKALAMSLCHLIWDNRLISEIKKLRRLVGVRFPIFVGGPGAAILKNANKDINAIVEIDLDSFREHLEKITNDE